MQRNIHMEKYVTKNEWMDGEVYFSTCLYKCPTLEGTAEIASAISDRTRVKVYSEMEKWIMWIFFRLGMSNKYREKNCSALENWWLE